MISTYTILEMSATLIEIAILLEFISKMLSNKHQGKKNIITLISTFGIISIYMLTTESLFANFSAIYNFIGIMFYVIYALLFTKSHLIYKIIIPVLSIMSVLFINIILTIAITYLFNIEPSDLLESDNAFRITMLFITKITFFLFTRFVLRKVTSSAPSAKAFSLRPL